MYTRYFDRLSSGTQQVFKTVMVEHNGKCIAVGSLLIRKLPNQKKISANLGHFMIDDTYPAHSQLLHTLIFSLESIAWIHGASYVVVSRNDVHKTKEIVKELEY